MTRLFVCQIPPLASLGRNDKKENTMARTYYLYIMTNRKRTLYIGVTNDLHRRVNQHRVGKGGMFTRRYKMKQLIYYEEYQYIEDAINREKQIKKWRREKKIKLIEIMNPAWDDLAKDWEY